MSEMESQLDSRLRSFFGEITTQGVPAALLGFEPASARPRGKIVNLAVGMVAFAVIATGVAVSAVELSNHGGTGAPIGAAQAAPTPSRSPTSYPRTTFVPMGVAPPGATVLLPLTRGTGSAQLPTFTWAADEWLYVETGCGAGVPGDTVTFAADDPAFTGDFTRDQCTGADRLEDGGLTTATTDGGAGGPVSLKVTVPASVQWIIFVYEAPPGLLGPGR